MNEIEAVLLKALQTVTAELDNPELSEITPNTDIIGNVDSFVIVDLMLESEMQLEAILGKYVTLADETIFDAEKSPLLNWSNWISYVEGRCDAS
jgi:hypothetical protein